MEEEIKKEEPFDSAQGKLEELELKCEEYLNNWKRSAADFINYKKDEMERMAVLLNYSKEDMIEKILPILDGIYLAEKNLPEDKSFREGFSQITKQIEDFLKKEGIEEIKTVGEKFNPINMEIVEEVEGGESGIVIEELQKGYIINDKVLRPAKVKVTK